MYIKQDKAKIQECILIEQKGTCWTASSNTSKHIKLSVNKRQAMYHHLFWLYKMDRFYMMIVVSIFFGLLYMSLTVLLTVFLYRETFKIDKLRTSYTARDW